MDTFLEFVASQPVKRQETNLTTRGRALARVLFGIAEEWELTQDQLADFLGRSKSTVFGWKSDGSVKTSKNLSPDDYQIIDFIQLYRVLSNVFAFKKDRTAWLFEVSEGFGGKSPYELVKEDPRNLRIVLEIISRIANP